MPLPDHFHFIILCIATVQGYLFSPLYSPSLSVPLIITGNSFREPFTDYCFGNFFPSLSIPFFVTGNLFREPFSCLLSNFTNLINWSLFTFTVFPQETPNGLRRFGVFITHHCSLFTVYILIPPLEPVPFRSFGISGGLGGVVTCNWLYV